MEQSSLLLISLRSMDEFCNVIRLNEHSIILFEASWMGLQGISKRESAMRAVFDLGVRKLYLLRVQGNDEVEDYIVNGMYVSTLPAIGIYSRGGFLECKVSVGADTFELNENDFLAMDKTLKHLLASKENEDRKDSSLMRIVDPIREVHSSFYRSSNEQDATIVSTVTVTVLDAVCSCLLGSRPTSWPLYKTDTEGDFEPFTIFISGDRSSVGKSTTCLAIIASLVKLGVNPEWIAYIKPVTQCESEQPITRYCKKVGIANQGVGPIVFYKGFTRAYLKGETEPAEDLLLQAAEAVRAIGIGRRIVIVDGVGYPSVGSICNLSNGHIAQALNTPVLLIGKPGVGDAVDSFNLNRVFFESFGVRVLGGIFNKLPMDGFYSLESCREAVSAYFDQYRTDQRAYGFVPELKPTVPSEEGREGGAAAGAGTLSEEELAHTLLQHVDLGRILLDAWNYSLEQRGVHVLIDTEEAISRPPQLPHPHPHYYTGGRQQPSQSHTRYSHTAYADTTDLYAHTYPGHPSVPNFSGAYVLHSTSSSFASQPHKPAPVPITASTVTRTIGGNSSSGAHQHPHTSNTSNSRGYGDTAHTAYASPANKHGVAMVSASAMSHLSSPSPSSSSASLLAPAPAPYPQQVLPSVPHTRVPVAVAVSLTGPPMSRPRPDIPAASNAASATSGAASSSSSAAAAAVGRKRSRDEIEQAAKDSGAKGG